MRYNLECDYTLTAREGGYKRVTTDIFHEPQHISTVLHYLMNSIANSNVTWRDRKVTIVSNNSVEVQEFERPPTVYRIVEVP